jgi:hypothetical protein
MSSERDHNAVSKVKEYITPGLITLVGFLIWAQLSELKQDVRTVLIGQTEVQVKTNILEKDVDNLKKVVYSREYGESSNEPSGRNLTAKKEDEIKVPSEQ